MPQHSKTAFLVFHGESAGGPLSGLVDGAKRANALDLLERARGSGAFGRRILFTNSSPLAAEAAGLADDVFATPDRGFHLGGTLRAAAGTYDLARIACVGSGAAHLLDASALAALAEARGPREVVANNLYSTDFCAFDCGGAFDAGDLPATDNGLSRMLVERAGFAGRELPRSWATLCDIDAPLDLAALKLAETASGRLRAYVDAHAPALPSLEAAARRFVDRAAEVLVAGRVSADTHLYLDRETACRVRLLAEERGMVAAAGGSKELPPGRCDPAAGGPGEARSILGMWIAHAGPAAAFASLEGRTHAAFVDTRLLLAHERLEVPMEERFAADLLMADRVATPYLRELCAAAASAPYPVVLASHALLNGGLMMVIDAAWRRFTDDASIPRGLRARDSLSAAGA